MSSKLERGLREISSELRRWQSVGKHNIAEDVSQLVKAFKIPRFNLHISGISGRVDTRALTLPPSSPKGEVIDALSGKEDIGKVSLAFEPEGGTASCLFVTNEVTGELMHICGTVNHEVEFIETDVTEYRPKRGPLQKYTPYGKFRTAQLLVAFLLNNFVPDRRGKTS